MTRVFLRLAAGTCCLVMTLAFPSSTMYAACDDSMNQLSAVVAHPAQYDGKTVCVVGFVLRSHWGNAIEDEKGALALRLSVASRAGQQRPKIVRDEQYRRFQDFITSLYAPALEDGRRFQVRVAGVVSVLKRGGKPVTKYDPRREAPVEFIPVQVFAFEEWPKQ